MHPNIFRVHCSIGEHQIGWSRIVLFGSGCKQRRDTCTHSLFSVKCSMTKTCCSPHSWCAIQKSLLIYCHTLTKGNKWQIIQIWDIDIFRLDFACYCLLYAGWVLSRNTHSAEWYSSQDIWYCIDDSVNDLNVLLIHENCHFHDLLPFVKVGQYTTWCRYIPYALTSRLHNNDAMLGGQDLSRCAHVLC